jgi:hypothetical protein
VTAFAAALLSVPAAAQADAGPQFTYGPILQGDAIVDSTLTVAAEWTGKATTATYTWERCSDTSTTCDPIGSDAAQYVVTAADVDYRLRVRVDLQNEDGTTTATTAPTAVVVAAPQPLPPPPPPSNPPPPAPPPAPPPPPADPAQTPILAAPAAAASATPARPLFMRPLPIVRIRGYFAPGGARITLLSVRGPRSARINVRCVGGGCPVHALSVRGPPVRLHVFERFLPSGTLLQIRVSRAGRIGKYTSFVIRTGKRPARADRCLMPGAWKPVACPAP